MSGRVYGSGKRGSMASRSPTASAYCRVGAIPASGRPVPSTGGQSSSIFCCGMRPASDRRDSSVRQLNDSHSPIVSPQSRLSTGSQGSGVPRIQELRRAEPAACLDPGVHPARIGRQHGARFRRQGRDNPPPPAAAGRACAWCGRSRASPGRRSPTAAPRRRAASSPSGTSGRARARSRAPRRRRWPMRRGCAGCRRHRSRYRPGRTVPGCAPAASVAAG